MANPEITFVNQLSVSGSLNGVVNLGFTTAQFLPAQRDGQIIVEAAEVMTANLRMDLFCAKQLHDALGQILEQNTKPSVSRAN